MVKEKVETVVVKTKNCFVFCENCEKILWEEDFPSMTQLLVAKIALMRHSEAPGEHRVYLKKLAYKN